MGETIRKYRKEKNMTQEEMANRLGVTPPAVNKWENGNSYPDITLLPPLARLLDISMDDLFSFQSELTREEIGEIVKEVDLKLKTDSFEDVCNLVKKKLEKYPNCLWLTWQLALVLDARRLYEEIPGSEAYDSFFEKCYQRAAESNDEELGYRAADSLYNFYLRKNQYEKAESCLTYFSKKDPERKRKQADIFRETGRTQEAYQIYEELLLAEFQRAGTILQGMYMLALKEDMGKAALLTEKMAELSKISEMGEYYEISSRLDLAVKEKDTQKVLDLAEKMFSSVEQIGNWTQSKLYEHMKLRELSADFIVQMRQNLWKYFKTAEDFNFLEKDDRWARFLEQYDPGR